MTQPSSTSSEPASGEHSTGAHSSGVDRKARWILPILMSGVMVLAVTSIVTYLNLGASPDFVARWLSAYLVAWPIAAVTGIVALPHVQRATTFLARRLERRG